MRKSFSLNVEVVVTISPLGNWIPIELKYWKCEGGALKRGWSLKKIQTLEKECLVINKKSLLHLSSLLFPSPYFSIFPPLLPLSMSQFGGEDPSEENLQQKTLSTLNVITLDASFCEYGRCYFPKSYCCNDKMVKPRRSICVIVHHVIFHMLMAKLTRLW